MKSKSCIALFFVTCCFEMLNAQIVEWASGTGSAGIDSTAAIEVDSTGNVFVTGMFSGTIDFDPSIGVTNLTATGFGNLFVAKYTKAGSLIWGHLILMGGFRVN